ncbi:MAG: Membrane protein involved in the export of O-antigen, teichoic acid lipoteichoic acid [Deltaproteobacteria bacterium]|nr:Membrane protein involved in the export of O-antigen, teichoic acid lipoteichoic acid [Deltaproteobacteria bacterium]
MTTSPLLQGLFVIGERLVFLVPQVTMFVLISRYLGREIFGQYTLVLTWALLFQTLANFGITECLAREIGREPECAGPYFTHGLILAIGFAGVAMAVMAAAAWAMQYRSGVTVAILLVGSTLVPAGILGACRGVLLATRKVEYMVAFGLAETLVVLPLNVYWVVTGASLLRIVATIVLAKMVAGGLAFVIVHWRVTRIGLPLRGALFRQLWKVTTPFGLAAQLPAIRFDVLLLAKMATFETLGLYSAAGKVAELLLMFPMAFYLTMLPRVAADLTQKPAPQTERFSDALAWYFALVIPLGIGVIGLAEPILRLVYGSAFTVAAPLLQIQTATFLLTTVDAMLMMTCRATGFQRADLKLVGITALCNLMLNVLLISHLGAVGAALAAALAILIGMTLRWRLVGSAIVKLNWNRLVGPPLAVSVTLLPVVLRLAPRVPWPLIGAAFGVGYSAIAAVSFPFLRNALRAALRQRRAIAG